MIEVVAASCWAEVTDLQAKTNADFRQSKEVKLYHDVATSLVQLHPVFSYFQQHGAELARPSNAKAMEVRPAAATAFTRSYHAKETIKSTRASLYRHCEMCSRS